MMSNILKKIKKANLVGRGGAAYPTYLKWQAVKKEKNFPKYVICNASEGELGLCKDIYILENFPEMVLKGMKIAMDFLGTKYAYFNFNAKYYELVRKRLDPMIKKHGDKGYVLRVFKEKPSYIGGEETALLNPIEGQRVEPRLKPPYPSEKGLFCQPTLIHNVETLFNIAKVEEGTYDVKRFMSVCGKVKNPGVFYFHENYTIEKVLHESKNYPDFDFFVQVGGSASGPVFNMEQIKEKIVTGAGSIEIYDKKMDVKKLLSKWFDFYANESCGKCTPCREGTFQLAKLVKDNKKVPWKEIMEILDTLDKTAFCALGGGVSVGVRSYLENVVCNS